MSDTVWTEELVERLKALWDLKHSSAEIARTLGHDLSRSAVLGKAHRLKLPRHPNGHNPRREYKTFARVWMAPPTLAAPLNVGLFELLPHHCRFPTTDDKPFLFCGIAKQTDSSYCPHHHNITHYSAKKISQATAEWRGFNLLRGGNLTNDQRLRAAANREEEA